MTVAQFQSITEGAFLMMSPAKQGGETNTLLKMFPLFAVIGTILVTFGAAQSQILRAQADIMQLQESHRADHDKLLEIKSDLKWIRERLDDALTK